MTPQVWLTIGAIILGPILALWAQRFSDRRRELRYRKLVIFKELMATRATRVSARHVEALNAIEVEFSSGKGSDKKVSDGWRLYLDHLNTGLSATPEPQAIERWHEKSSDLLVEVLHEMSRALGYSFDKVALKKSVYYPRAHGELETEQELLRRSLLELMAGRRLLWTGVMTGEKPLRMEIVVPRSAPE